MSVFSIILIAIGLSMDAFAVSVCKGLKMRKIDYGKTLLIGLFFGGFQALMPVIGWLIGIKFQKHIESFDH
ncbi:MAG: manganese efflux pump, partial [Clostridia bacterium]|nr:manganese efflux pump [Clostridia bacterium]